MKAPVAARTLRSAAEASIVVLAKAGDNDAFDELVRRRQGFVRSILRRLCRDPALADDLAQQTFVQAWRSIGQLRAAGAFPGWLRRLAVNGWLQYLRAQHLDVESLDALADGQVAIPAAPSAVTEQLDLDGALARLAPAARLCIVLAYHEGMSHAEISEGTAIPLGTVKSHVLRGSALLREYLKDYP